MKCLICGCTDEDCSECIDLMGSPCSWALTVASYSPAIFPKASSAFALFTGKADEKFGVCTTCVYLAKWKRSTSSQAVARRKKKRALR